MGTGCHKPRRQEGVPFQNGHFALAALRIPMGTCEECTLPANYGIRSGDRASSCRLHKGTEGRSILRALFPLWRRTLVGRPPLRYAPHLCFHSGLWSAARHYATPAPESLEATRS
jgi:hypothetical protein